MAALYALTAVGCASNGKAQEILYGGGSDTTFFQRIDVSTDFWVDLTH